MLVADLARDAGHTKADRHDNNLKFFCLYFARGCCAHGKDCQFAHRIPVNADIKRLALDETKDIFGRERHREHRDDMGGVGAIMKPCRTLYAGGLTKTEYKDPRALEECLCFPGASVPAGRARRRTIFTADSEIRCEPEA